MDQTVERFQCALLSIRSDGFLKRKIEAYDPAEEAVFISAAQKKTPDRRTFFDRIVPGCGIIKDAVEDGRIEGADFTDINIGAEAGF